MVFEKSFYRSFSEKSGEQDWQGETVIVSLFLLKELKIALVTGEFVLLCVKDELSFSGILTGALD